MVHLCLNVSFDTPATGILVLPVSGCLTVATPNIDGLALKRRGVDLRPQHCDAATSCETELGSVRPPTATPTTEGPTWVIPASFLEPLPRSWSHFLGIYRQILTTFLKT